MVSINNLSYQPIIFFQPDIDQPKPCLDFINCPTIATHFEDFISESHFYASNNDKSLELFAINYSTNNKIDPNNFQQILELSLDKLESYGLQNFLVKYDNFESNNGAKGLIISGDTDFLDDKKNIKNYFE